MPTKTVKLEIVELEPSDRERLKVASRTMRELSNFVWRQWEAWHTVNETAAKLVAQIESKPGVGASRQKNSRQSPQMGGSAVA